MSYTQSPTDETVVEEAIADEVIDRQVEELFARQQQTIFKHTDRMFAVLMALQWLGGIAAALWFSPQTWSGGASQIHIHVWTAIFLGGAISFLPIALALQFPGRTMTRYVIAIGQMLMSSLLIHLTGGRLETHFHIFGSLAFLSFYRDPRVLVPATVIVAADHILRGEFWPESVYGVLAVDNLRWVEHAWWVIFEDVFLFIAIRRSVSEMRNIAKTNVRIRNLNMGLENRVHERTAQLEEINKDLQTQAAERKSTEDALRASENRFRSVVESANDAIFLADKKGNILSWNIGARKVFGYKKKEIIGQSISKLFPATYSLGNSEEDRGATLLASWCLHTDRKVTEKNGVKKDGIEFPIELSLSSWETVEGTFYSGIIRDMTERKSLEDKLTHQALHDPLTGLANRPLFRDRVQYALEKIERNRQPVSILFLDLDNFKTINDSLGHSAGDELLVTVAGRLLTCLRPSDTAARLGGDEFAILIEKITTPSDVVNIAERIRSILHAPFILDGKEVFISASIGIVSTMNGKEDPSELIRNADVAMYMAKSQGRDCYATFRTEMHDEVVKRLQLEADMRRAIDREEFEVYYQPIMDLQWKKVTGMEALVRWNHPEKGMVPPADFIPIAEETNLIIPLGKWILEESCRQAREWQKNCGFGDELLLTVNISSRQFQDEKLVKIVKEALDKSGLPAQNLILEITESAMIKNTETMITKLEALKKTGVKIAIDDFGTGYSSFSYLRRFPIDILKIDKSFIDLIGQGEEGTAVAKAIITMSHAMHLKTIAEGIENEEQSAALYDLGCEMGQGYHFAKPLKRDEMSDFLHRSYSDGLESVQEVLFDHKDMTQSEMLLALG